jgi:hypothetical protein
MGGWVADSTEGACVQGLHTRARTQMVWGLGIRPNYHHHVSDRRAAASALVRALRSAYNVSQAEEIAGASPKLKAVYVVRVRGGGGGLCWALVCSGVSARIDGLPYSMTSHTALPQTDKPRYVSNRQTVVGALQRAGFEGGCGGAVRRACCGPHKGPHTRAHPHKQIPP